MLQGRKRAAAQSFVLGDVVACKFFLTSLQHKFHFACGILCLGITDNNAVKLVQQKVNSPQLKSQHKYLIVLTDRE